MLCRDATFRALQREGHAARRMKSSWSLSVLLATARVETRCSQESLITKLHESPSRCRETIAGVLKHALRLAASQSGAASPILSSLLAAILADFVSSSSYAVGAMFFPQT